MCICVCECEYFCFATAHQRFSFSFYVIWFPIDNQRVIDTHTHTHNSTCKSTHLIPNESEAIFIFIYKCAFIRNMKQGKNESKRIAEKGREEDEKINKRLSLSIVRLYNNSWCELYLQAKAAEQAIYHFLLYSWMLLTQCVKIMLFENGKRTKFASKRKIHIYKWVRSQEDACEYT